MKAIGNFSTSFVNTRFFTCVPFPPTNSIPYTSIKDILNFSRIKQQVMFLLFLPYLIHGEIKPECTKEITNSYLDIAVEMIKKVRETNLICPKVKVEPLDCADVLRNNQTQSGVYQVFPKSRVLNGRPVEVFCDLDTDGGGWTIIQRRGNNFLSVKDYFYRDWNSYKNGFGDIERDFWLGNDNIFALSSQKLYSIRFDLQDLEGEKRYAVYDTFWIDDEDHNYTLHINGCRGDAGDSMITAHDGRKFSTKDRDTDQENENYAQKYRGGWWYSEYYFNSSNLNGLYYRRRVESLLGRDGVFWNSWKRTCESMARTEIKIRPKDFRRVTLSLDVTSG